MEREHSLSFELFRQGIIDLNSRMLHDSIEPSRLQPPLPSPGDRYGEVTRPDDFHDNSGEGQENDDVNRLESNLAPQSYVRRLVAVEAWFNSLPEVPPDEQPKVDRIIFDALDRVIGRRGGRRPPAP